jgi:hypothetical protein
MAKKSTGKPKKMKDLSPREQSGRKVKGGQSTQNVVQRLAGQIRRKGGPAE